MPIPFLIWGAVAAAGALLAGNEISKHDEINNEIEEMNSANESREKQIKLKLQSSIKALMENIELENKKNETLLFVENKLASQIKDISVEINQIKVKKFFASIFLLAFFPIAIPIKLLFFKKTNLKQLLNSKNNEKNYLKEQIETNLQEQNKICEKIEELELKLHKYKNLLNKNENT